MDVQVIAPGDDPRAVLKELARVFDLRGSGLGADLLDAALDGIAINCAAMRDSDGFPWAPLSPDYAIDKAAKYPGEPTGRRMGDMLDPANLRGVRQVTNALARMTYGVNGVAIEEAEYFIEGDAARRRPAREFYGFTAAAVARADAILDAHFAATLDAA